MFYYLAIVILLKVMALDSILHLYPSEFTKEGTSKTKTKDEGVLSPLYSSTT